jgi:hypothetical protein
MISNTDPTLFIYSTEHMLVKVYKCRAFFASALPLPMPHLQCPCAIRTSDVYVRLWGSIDPEIKPEKIGSPDAYLKLRCGMSSEEGNAIRLVTGRGRFGRQCGAGCRLKSFVGSAGRRRVDS